MKRIYHFKKRILVKTLQTSAKMVAGILIPAFALASTQVYLVKPGDTLSGILKNHNAGPIYGKGGSLETVLQLNPEKLSSNGNQIYPGEKIILSEASSDVTPVAEVSETPTAAVERKVASEDTDSDEVRSFFQAGLGLDYFRFDAQDSATGARSVILSNLSPALHLGWTLQWNENTAFVVQTVFERYSLQPPKLTTFDHLTGVRSAFSFGISQRFSERLEAGLKLVLQDRLFFHASGLTELTVDQVMVASPVLSLRYALLSKPGGQVGVSGGFGLMMSGSNAYYDVKSGTHAEAGIFMTRKPKNAKHVFECNLNYTIDSQDTSLMTETEKKFLLKLIYHFED